MLALQQSARGALFLTRMVKTQRFLVVALFVFVVASPHMEAQSAPAQSSETLVDGLPTDIGVPGDLSTAVPSTKKSKKARSMAAITPAEPQLCFLPGVGWQNVSFPTVGNAEGSSGLERFGNTRIGQLAPKRAWKPAYRRPSGGEQASNTVCSELVGNTMQSGLSMGHQAEPMHPAASIDTNAATNNESANSELSSTDMNASRGALLGSRPKPAAGTVILGAQSDRLRNRAYESPFKLRREIWNAPDLQTRIRLERQLERLANKSARSDHDLGANRSLKQYGKRRNRTRMQRSFREEDRKSRR